MTQTRAFLLLTGSYAAADQPGIHAFRLAADTGALTPLAAFAGVANPSFIALGPDGQTLYATSETSAGDGAPGGVAALRLARDPLGLTPLGQQRSGGNWPCHVQLTPDGRLALATNYGSGSVAALPVLADGALGPMSDLAQHEGRSAHPERQAGPHAHSSIVTGDGRLAIVADLGIDRLMVYQIDAAAGKLTHRGDTLARRGAGPRHMAFHPGGHLLYVANELDCTVSTYSLGPGEGELRELQSLPTLPAGAPATLVADIHLDEAARRLYVSNRGHNSLAIFDLDPQGMLSPVAVAPCGGDWPRNFALVPGGRFAVVANQHSGELVVLPLFAGPEAVGAPVARAAVPQVSCVIVAGTEAAHD